MPSHPFAAGYFRSQMNFSHLSSVPCSSVASPQDGLDHVRWQEWRFVRTPAGSPNFSNNVAEAAGSSKGNASPLISQAVAAVRWHRQWQAKGLLGACGWTRTVAPGVDGDEGRGKSGQVRHTYRVGSAAGERMQRQSVIRSQSAFGGRYSLV